MQIELWRQKPDFSRLRVVLGGKVKWWRQQQVWPILISDLAVKGRKQKMGNLKICFLFKMEEVWNANE